MKLRAITANEAVKAIPVKTELPVSLIKPAMLINVIPLNPAPTPMIEKLIPNVQTMTVTKFIHITNHGIITEDTLCPLPVIDIKFLFILSKSAIALSD